jgi:hypothetical protein
MDTFEVVSPVGAETINRSSIAPRLANLDGKTIGEIWNGVYKGNESFPALREMLKQRYPTLKIIPYTEFPSNYGGETLREQIDSAKKLALSFKERGCDAVISGNGA